MGKKSSEDEELYFIVESAQLSSYGSETGSTKEEAERLLEEAGQVDHLVVIKGQLIRPKFLL